MCIFNLFKRKKRGLTDQEKKWNLMWEKWTEGKTVSPYTELMTYQSEINNGGHCQYFDNVGNTGDLQKEMMALGSVLSVCLWENLQEAYRAYLILEEKEVDQNAEDVLERCDQVFYENEEEINHMLSGYASEMEIKE